MAITRASITQFGDGRWQARVTLEGGRRKAYYGATRAEAAAKLHTVLRERDRGLPIVGEKQRVGQYLEIWLETVKAQIRANSHRRYSDYVRIHLIPGLGKVRSRS